MKTLSRRAWVLYVVVLAFLTGAGILVYTFVTNADSWAMKRTNRHIYNSGVLSTAGTITDESGEILAQSVDGKRQYNSSKKVRTATLHIVGDSQGYIGTGVQTAYSDVLTGYDLINGVYTLKQYGKGSDIKLTVNAELCAAAYDALGDNKGTVGVYNYKTGEMLCVISKPSYDIANKPTVDINNDKTGRYEGVYLNRFFSGVYTPGSTFKIITSACAIDNIPDIDSRSFKCEGEYKVGVDSIKCLSTHGKLNFERALNQSCNSAFAQIAIELGAEKLTATTDSLGFGQTFNIGKIRLAKSSFDISDAATVNIGWAGIGQYTTRVNPCHMLTIVGAIANNGTSPAPYFIKQINSPSGSLRYKASTTMLAPMFSETTAQRLQKMLRSNVVNYYGDGKFKGLEMCGKTGSAEINGDLPHSWFVGFSQRQDLPYAIVVIAENSGLATSIAVPIASQVMSMLKYRFTQK